MLYRGISKSKDAENNGEILPKGNLTAVTPLIDGTWNIDGKMLIGCSDSNTARAHHIKSGHWGGSGISTSRSESLASRFATNNFTENGFVYVIDESVLEAHDVTKYEFSDPLYPDEFEVTLIVGGGNKLPKDVVIEKYAVNSEGKRA